MDDSVRSFPCGAKLSLGRVFSCCGDFAQDDVTYVQSSEFNPLIVVFGHLLLVLCHLAGSFVSYFVQTIQVESQLIVIAFFVEYLSPDAGYSYFDQDHCLSAIGEPEGGFSSRTSCCSPVSLQDIGQLFWLGAFRIIQLGFDNFEQCPICYFRLSIRLGMPQG